MANTKILWCVTALVMGSAAAGRAAAELSVGVAADVLSKYVWRGQSIVNDWVLQPSASVGYKGLTGSVWGNMDLTGEGVEGGEFNEIDLALDYSNKVPGFETLGYSVGVVHYDFPNTVFPATDEVYGALTASVPLSPAVRWYYDFDEIEGSYVQLALGHTIEKLHAWRDDCYCGLQLGASVAYGTEGYNEGYFGVHQGAWNDLTVTAGLPFCIGKLTIRPTINYSTLLDEDLRAGRAHNDNFWGGVGFAYSF